MHYLFYDGYECLASFGSISIVFWSGGFILIAHFPDHCLLVPFLVFCHLLKKQKGRTITTTDLPMKYLPSGQNVFVMAINMKNDWIFELDSSIILD